VKPPAGSVQHLGHAALDELGEVLDRMRHETLDRFCDEILGAQRIALYGAGREGLMMRAFGMRLMHLGLDAHVVGDMTTPPVGRGDLLMVSAGPGGVSTVLALLGVARRDGARTLAITAQPVGPAGERADAVFHIPAQTMADDRGPTTSVLPMGSLFEAAQLLVFDLVSIMLRDRTGQGTEAMRARHTNLE
jgi:6-phospho-3-hexuloisomerase